MIWEIDDGAREIEGVDADGRADPAYAAALGLLPAPLGRRALAVVVDAVLFLALLLPFALGAVPLLAKLASGSISLYGFLNHPGFVLAVVFAGVSTLFGLVYLVVQLILHGIKGLTIGKVVAGLRTVEVRTLERPRVWRVFVRDVLVAASGIVPVLGPVLLLVSPTFDPGHRGRGLHDVATGVWLVDVRRGLDPYDQKRMRVARKMVKAEPAPERSALPSLATSADVDAPAAYRPGSRISAGVLGMARPHESRERPVVGLSLATPTPTAASATPGTPVLGGYRTPGAEPAPSPAPSPSPAPEPVAPAPEPAPLAPAAPEQRMPAPAASAPEPAPPTAPPPTAAPPVALGLRFETGELIPVAATVLIGRNPDAAEHPGATAIALADDSRSLSKTHLLARPVAHGLEIVDQHSTNGSGVLRAGTEHAAAPGVPVVAVDGDAIRLGDRVAAVVRVAPAGEDPR